MGYAIVTRYHGPTNYRGSRVIGTGPAAHLPPWDAAPGTREPLTRATVSWDHAADSMGNHRNAARAVAAKLRAEGWAVYIAPDDTGATLPSEDGYAWTLRYRSEDRACMRTLAPEGYCALPADHVGPHADADGIERAGA